jgi:hypothetical protein
LREGKGGRWAKRADQNKAPETQNHDSHLLGCGGAVALLLHLGRDGGGLLRLAARGQLLPGKLPPVCAEKGLFFTCWVTVGVRGLRVVERVGFELEGWNDVDESGLFYRQVARV